MVRVVMAAQISGTRNGATWPPPGGEIDLPETEAADMIRNCLAIAAEAALVEEIAEEAPVEAAAIKEPAERATKPKTVTRAKFRGGK